MPKAYFTNLPPGKSPFWLALSLSCSRIDNAHNLGETRAGRQEQATLLFYVRCRRERPTPVRPAADDERSNSAPFCCQGVGPRHARLRLRVAPVPLRALDSGRCVAPWEVSAPEECRSLSHQRNAGRSGGDRHHGTVRLCSTPTVMCVATALKMSIFLAIPPQCSYSCR